MELARIYVEKLLFPGWSPGQRRRHMRFLMLGIFLGVILAGVFGGTLYLLNYQGQI